MPEFEHRLNEKGLDDPAANLRILENTPRISAVALSLEADFMDQAEKGFDILRVDPIFDRDQDRPLIVLNRMHEHRRPPVHRWREIERGRGLQSPPRGYDHPDCRTRRSKKKGGRHSLDACDLAPNGAAKCHRAEKRCEKNREAPSAHPLRQRHLR